MTWGEALARAQLVFGGEPATPGKSLSALMSLTGLARPVIEGEVVTERPATIDAEATARLIIEAHRKATSPPEPAPLPPEGSVARRIVLAGRKVGACW